MANGEWLNQLIAGLGGAFTGAGQARTRMAEEQEAERKRQEVQNERDRLKRIQALRGGQYSEASARELLSLGDTPGNVEALKEMFTPKAKPKYEERKEPGGVSIYEDDRFKGWKSKTPAPTRETGPTKEEEQIGGAWLTNWLGTADPEDRMRRSTLYNQMRKQGVPYGQIGWSLMQAESVGGRQMGQNLRNLRMTQTPDDPFADILP